MPALPALSHLPATLLPCPALPSGINIKADVSMCLACFLGSLCILGLLHGAYGLLVGLRLLDPRLYSPMAGAAEVWSIVLMNSVNLAVACATYYSFCGNASPADSSGGGGGGGAGWKEAVCHKWLHPVSASSHSAFTRFVIYGEAAAAAAAAADDSGGIGDVAAAVAGATAAAASKGRRLWFSPPPPPPPLSLSRISSFVQMDFPLDGKASGRSCCCCCWTWPPAGGSSSRAQAHLQPCPAHCLAAQPTRTCPAH